MRRISVKNKTVLKIDDLQVFYGHIRALKGVSLEATDGEFIALLGANGAGKSTIIGAMLGLARSQRGTVHFMGSDITNKSTEHIVASGISVVPEGRGVLPLMTVMENLQLGAYCLRGDFDILLSRVFARFPILDERRDQLAGTLSGGQQQMLAIGRALMAAPKLLVMDEPSLGLAPLLVKEVFEILEGLKNEGQTILLAEQNARKALQCADRAYVFEAGKIVCEGSARELVCDTRVLEAYLGGSV
jgi:branched-chain amino acid transport system ATP-binding protein